MASRVGVLQNLKATFVNVFWPRVQTEALLKLNPQSFGCSEVMAVLQCNEQAALFVLRTAERQGRFALNTDGTYRLLEAAEAPRG